MKRKVKLTEKDLHRLINESVRRVMNEADNYGWVVEESEAQEAYDLAVEHFGEEELNKEIVGGLSSNELAESLAYIFRMYDFTEWDDYKASKESGEEI